MPHIIQDKIFRLFGKIGAVYDTRFPYGLLGTDAYWDALYSAWIDSITYSEATTYYCSPFDGSDETGNGTLGNEWRSIRYSLNQMARGDKLIVRGEGVVLNDDLFAINDHVEPIPSGYSRTARTIITAEVPFGLTFKWNNNTRHYYYEPIRFEICQFVLVDGFKIDWQDDDGDPENLVKMSAPENVITRCFFRKNKFLTYGGFVDMSPGYKNLLQDCAGVGVGRYPFFTGSGNNPDLLAGYNTMRRVVCRLDYVKENQPKACFGHYGQEAYSTYNGRTTFQNCFVIDSVYDWPSGTYGYVWGGFYNPKNAYDIKHQGCAVINSSGRGAFWLTDYNASLTSLAEDMMAVNTNGYYDPPDASRDGLHANNPGAPMVGFHANNNGIYRKLTAWGLPGISFDNGMVPTQSNDSVKPPSAIYDPNGADLRYAYGKFGSVNGETGHDLITTDPLFLGAYPYESKIREWFRGASVTPATGGYYPPGVQPDRGFCADGQTLTRYLAGITGEDPDEILAGLYA